MLQLELLPNECIRLRYLRLNYILNSDLKINDMLFGGLMQYGFCRFTDAQGKIQLQFISQFPLHENSI